MMTWTGDADRVAKVAGGLARLGVVPGEAVAIMLTERPESYLVDAAAMHLGAVPFSLHHATAREHLAQILINSDARVLITESPFGATAGVLRAACGLEHVVVLDGPEGLTTLADLEREGGSLLLT
jgi:long-subunit acyl-CoA synthetase (AMP-forming)